MNETEKRACERYDLKLPIQARWENGLGGVKEETGATKDISSSGAFMSCKTLIEDGREIDLQIDLPIVGTEATKGRVLARGRVVRNVRMTGSDMPCGHGIMFNNYSLLRS